MHVDIDDHCILLVVGNIVDGSAEKGRRSLPYLLLVGRMGVATVIEQRRSFNVRHMQMLASAH
jgi:hypothetical protein